MINSNWICNRLKKPHPLMFITKRSKILNKSSKKNWRKWKKNRMILRVLTKLWASKTLRKIIKFRRLRNNNKISKKNWMSYKINLKSKKTILPKVRKKKRNCSRNLKNLTKKTLSLKFKSQQVARKSIWILFLKKRILRVFYTFIKLLLRNKCRWIPSNI